MNLLKRVDPIIYKLVLAEEKRQKEVLEMIPSENYTSKAVMEALGTVLTNKYSEGYPHKRYYQGNRIIDDIEMLAQERAKKLFKVPYVNVQPLSGSPANAAVYMAILNPGDKIMGLSLAFGGHLTHGAPLTFSSRFFKSVQYTLGKDKLIDFTEVEKLALKEKPQVIVCGFTAYPSIIDFERFGEIADKVKAYLLADISHIAGLIVAGVHPSPVNYAHIVTTTTHKTLRGPRGAMIMVTDKGLKKNPDLAKKIDSAIIPGLQGGPHDNQTAAIAVALLEASKPAFKRYGQQVVKNSKALAKHLVAFGFDLVSGGSENHLILIDLKNKNVNGAVAALALETAGIVVNKNGVPFDTNPPFYPSGIRLGTPAITTRGLSQKDMIKVADWMHRTIEEVKGVDLPTDKEKRKEVWKAKKAEIVKNKKLLDIAKEVKNFTAKFPIG
ncbi:MAG: serine hydroxymethyltransferase [Candidatus Levybacteria bacterium]|nr:serine hydroxymethyltransferase [Candidatus Levybacteria bacterium]